MRDEQHRWGECPEEGWKRYTPQTGPRASTGPRGFGAVPRAVPLLINSGRRFHRTFCTGPQHLLSSGLTLKNTGENTVKLCPALCCVPSAVSGSRHEPWGRRERAEACLCVDTPQSLLVLRQGPVCTVRVLSCEYRTVAPSTACSQHCKQPCIKSSPRFPSDPSWGLVVECSFPRRGPWDKSPSAPACQYLHA